MRLVDADILLDRVEWANTNPLLDHGKTAVQLIKNAPTIEERKKGKWTKISPANIYECSVCGQNVMTADIDAYRFCHGCGADMREEGEK